MAFNHRKLILDSLNRTQILIQYCQPYCELDLPPPPPRPPPPITSYNPPSKSPKLPLYLVISLSILVATFTLFCCYIIYRCFKGRNRSRNRSSQLEPDGTHDDILDEEHEPSVDHHVWYIRTVGLNPSTINAITICKYKKTDGLVEGTDCSVCLNEFQEDETLRLLPKCNHAFHIPCIDMWLMSHTNCPLCRASVVNSTTGSPAPEMAVDDESSHVEEEAQLGVSEDDGNNEIEMVEMSKRNDDVEVGGFQPVRRSVSLDSSSASMISAAIANAHHPGRSATSSDTQLVKVGDLNMGFVPKRVDTNKSLLRLMGSSSIVRSLQKGPISMKRSFSCSGKVLSSRHGRSTNLILPS